MSARTLSIESPGLFTTVQDLGRTGLARLGVARGGALDRTALMLGNRLVGNDPGAAGLECTLNGPVVRFNAETTFAVTGADLGPMLNGKPVPLWQPVAAPAGSVLSFAPSPIGSGARAYLTVAGGIALPEVLGSRSTDLAGGFGGVEGRPLRSGDLLSLGRAADDVALLRNRLAFDPPALTAAVTIRVVTGPQEHRFTEAGLNTLFEHAFTVTSRSDRTGIRLSGPTIEHTSGADIISEGNALGAIQVPGDGQPIILLTARHTAGGYVKIATVIGADLDRLGQVRSGDELRFTEVTVEEARRATAEALRTLDASAIVTLDEDEVDRMTDAAASWTPEGVARVIAEAERAGVTHLKLEVASAGISLEIARDGNAAPPPTDGDTSVPNDAFIAITAPTIGTFYRRPSPEAEEFVELGQAVKAGDPIGLIEVMKNYQEVTAPADGIIISFLAEDGHYVEFGQALASLRPG